MKLDKLITQMETFSKNVLPFPQIDCKGVLLIEIRCNKVTNFLIPSAGNQFVTVMKDVTITDDI